jgi:ribosomal-protein-serine acetyltransferase
MLFSDSRRKRRDQRVCYPKRVGDQIEIRGWQIADAEELQAAIIESHKHLKPFMPWVDDAVAMTLEQRRDFVAGWMTNQKERNFGIWRDHRLLAVMGLHDRIAEDGLEIGYWVRVSEINKGIATFGAMRLTEIAFENPIITHVEIHHDSANLASERVPQKLGFTFIDESERELDAPASSGKFKVWRVDRDVWEKNA